jgi:hypothetical protein
MNKLITSLVGSAALAATAFAGPSASSGKGGASVTPPASSTASHEGIGATLGVGYDTDFYFRGLDIGGGLGQLVGIGEDWITASLGYGVAISDGLNLDLGANYGSNYGGDISYDRLVASAALSQKFGAVDASLGYRFYNHDGLGGLLFEDSSEVFVNLGSQVGIFNLGLASNYDVTNEGFYFELGGNTEIKLTESISLVPGANIGYASDYNFQLGGAGADGFTAVTVSLAAPIKLCACATLTPYIAGRLPVDALKDAGWDNEVYGGVSLTVKF